MCTDVNMSVFYWILSQLHVLLGHEAVNVKLQCIFCAFEKHKNPNMSDVFVRRLCLIEKTNSSLPVLTDTSGAMLMDGETDSCSQPSF